MNKLSRTFATLVSALKHHRTGGEQKLTVRHVAVVGTVSQAPRDVLPGRTPNVTPALADARQTAMEIVGERKRKPVRSGSGDADD